MSVEPVKMAFTASCSRCSSTPSAPQPSSMKGLSESGIQAVDIHVLPSGVATVHAACASDCDTRGTARTGRPVRGVERRVVRGARTCVEPLPGAPRGEGQTSRSCFLPTTRRRRNYLESRRILVSPPDQRSFSRHVQPCAPAAGFERRGRGRTRCWHRWCAVLRARLRALCGHGSA